MKTIMALLVLALALALFQPMVSAQEEEDVYFSFGTVEAAASDKIVVKEVIYDEDEETEISEDVVYIVSSDTELENAGSVAAIPKGTEVDVEYVEAAGVKTAKYVYVYGPEETE